MGCKILFYKQVDFFFQFIGWFKFFFECDKSFNDFFLYWIRFFDYVCFCNSWMFDKFVFYFKWVDVFIGGYDDVINFVLELEIFFIIYISRIVRYILVVWYEI